ncbi:response regulator [Actibacterium sp. D379-3]
MRILAVDDDEIILELLSATLSATGYTDLTLATSAQQAARIIRDADVPFDCFLLDIQMPDIDGIELCSAIRNTREYQSTPILMITAMSQKSYIDRAFAAGATDYVTKPFDPTELGARIRMAERLVQSSRKVEENVSAVESLRSELERDRFIDLNEVITISDIDGFISLTALENYLLQLSRGGLFATTIFAFKVVGVERIFASTPPTDFRYLLTDVAEAISNALRSNDIFLTYAGNGIYLCVAHGKGIPELDTVERAVNLNIEEMELTDSNGVALNVVVQVGKPVRVGLLRAGRGAVQALAVAAENAEHAAAHSQVREQWRPHWGGKTRSA